jgi:hypothetical protein
MLKRYIGDQSFWNQGAVNDRERYYYGYGGFWGAGVSRDPKDYQILREQKVPCDALTQDCWSKPCGSNSGVGTAESFEVEGNGVGVLGLVGIAAAVVLFCKLCSK